MESRDIWECEVGLISQSCECVNYENVEERKQRKRVRKRHVIA